MPNYDIIPLAVDLLDYTIQRVKTKEPEYRKIKALVQENGQLAERELFEKIRDDGKPHFPKSQTFHLCARLEECATTILEKCISADGRYFETDFEDRLKDLDAVLVACDTMLQHINLSFKKKYITGDQCHYWAELVRPVRQKAFSWRRNDGNRAAALREAKRAQVLAKMSQMAQQIAEAMVKRSFTDIPAMSRCIGVWPVYILPRRARTSTAAPTTCTPVALSAASAAAIPTGPVPL